MTYDIPVAALPIAQSQSGAVSRPQLLEAGFTSKLINARLKRRRWQQLYWGVYAVFTGPVPRETELWAALLRAGAGAALSYLTAAELHGLIDHPAESIYTTVPSTRRVAVPGVVIRTSSRIAEAAQPGREPPRTNIEETVFDLIELAVTFDDACGWITRAVGKRLTTDERLSAALKLRKKMRWRAQLEDVLAAAGDGIHSVLEYRYLRDVERAHGLPRSRHQVRMVVDGKIVYRDAYYQEYKLAVELDGRLAHPEEERRRDRHRDNKAGVDGILTTRYDWQDVRGHPCETALLQAQILRRRGWRGRPRPCSAGCPLAGFPVNGMPAAGRIDGPDRLRSFRPIASTRATGFASYLVRLGESGTPSLVLCPEPGTVRPWMTSTPVSWPS
jgi:predicted transcriptional regulator of viral defense system